MHELIVQLSNFYERSLGTAGTTWTPPTSFKRNTVKYWVQPVSVAARNVERHGVVIADVLGESYPGLPVEHDDTRRSLEAREEVVLAALVVVEATDHTPARKRDIRLHEIGRAHV